MFARLTGLCCALVAVVTANTASASPFIATQFTGDSATVSITLTQNGANSVDVSLSVITNAMSPNTGDLRGFFFNVVGDNLTGLTVMSGSGAPVTSVLASANAVTNLGGGNNINPEGPFDVGVELGNPGIGMGDDFQTSVFTITRPGGLSILDLTTDTDPATASGPNLLLFGVRLTSVGLPGGPRNGSSKLGATVDNTPPPFPGPDPDVVPEPATVATFGLMTLLGAAGIRLRRKTPAAA